LKKVFLSGAFNFLHGGHIKFFKQAKELGDYLIVSIPSPEVLILSKKRVSYLPLEHKLDVLRSIKYIDEVVVDNMTKKPGRNGLLESGKVKVDIWGAISDEPHLEEKRELAKKLGIELVVIPRILDYKPVTSTDLFNKIKTPRELPLKVNFAGGWLSAPRSNIKEGYIINCAISPLASLEKWPYKIKSG